MPRRKGSPNIQPKTEGVVKLINIQHPNFSASQIRNFLLKNHKEYGLLEDEIPRKRSIQQVIHDWKNPRTLEHKGLKEKVEKLRRPWHLGLMSEYREHITPDAVPYIFAVQKRLDKDNVEILAAITEHLIEHPELTIGDSEIDQAMQAITVGEAIWISRLFRLVKNTEDEQIDKLMEMCRFYSLMEQVSMLSGKPEFDAVEIDRALRNDELTELAHSVFENATRTIVPNEQLSGKRQKDGERK
jgi:hypothetical protein